MAAAETNPETCAGGDGPDPPLVVRLFGAFETHVRGCPLPRLRTRKGQWLLALLVLRPGEELERDWLAGRLWPESPHPRALANLRSSLQDLRRALGPEAFRLRSPTRTTLTLDLAGAEVDVLAFDAAAAQDEPAALGHAVALYRGPLLERCAEEWAFQERQLREHAYLHALERLAAHARAGGDLVAAEQYFRRSVMVDPHRERTQRELMQLLAGQGSYAAALQVYRDLRLRLHRELNAAPDPQTQSLFEQIRTAVSGSTSVPSPVTSLSRQRVRARPGNLPAPPTSLLGREHEIAILRERLCGQSGRLVTLTGPAGTGKTRLALQAALEVQDEFPEGAFFVSLAPLRDPELLASAIAVALGVRERAGQPQVDILKESLREKQMLLLLDNFEHLLVSAPLVAELLAAAPRLQVLVTSRAALRLRGEKRLPVPPLALPPRGDGVGDRAPGVGKGRPDSSGPHTPPPAPDTLTPYAAVQLFVERARDVQSEFMLTEQNASAVAEICRRLDGLPLAIELAAARVSLLPPQAMLSRLDGRLKLLTGGARDLPERHQTLRSAIAWSYNLLSEYEKEIFHRLSVFVGGFTLEAAEAVCGERSQVLDGIASLLDKSLLRREDSSDGEGRFTMLETVGEFGRECLAASGAEKELRRRHARYFREWAEAMEQVGWTSGGARHLDGAEQEQNNLRAALSWALEMGASGEQEGAAEEGLRLAAALSSFWSIRAYQGEAQGWLSRLLALPSAERRTSARASALAAFADHVWYFGEHLKGLAVAEESLELWRELGERSGIARALYSVGRKHSIFDRHELALALLEEGLNLSRELGDRRGIARFLCGLAGIGYRTCDLDSASRFLTEAAAIYRAIGDPGGLILPLGDLSLFAMYREQYDTAHRFSLEWLEVARELGDAGMMTGALQRIGAAAYARGDIESARDYWEQALDIVRQQESRYAGGGILRSLGRLACLQGSYVTARMLFEEALAEARAQNGDDVSRLANIGHALMGLGEVACGEGYLAEARAAYRESIAAWKQWVWTDALPKFGPKVRIARCLDGLSAVAAKADQPARAAQGFAAAAAVREALEVHLPQPDAAEWERQVAQVRATLGEAAFTIAWEQGRARPLDEAITLVAGEPQRG